MKTNKHFKNVQTINVLRKSEKGKGTNEITYYSFYLENNHSNIE